MMPYSSTAPQTTPPKMTTKLNQLRYSFTTKTDHDNFHKVRIHCRAVELLVLALSNKLATVYYAELNQFSLGKSSQIVFIWVTTMSPFSNVNQFQLGSLAWKPVGTPWLACCLSSRTQRTESVKSIECTQIKQCLFSFFFQVENKFCHNYKVDFISLFLEDAYCSSYFHE